MPCTSPRTVGFQADGKTLAWSEKTSSREYAKFQLPCGKCIDCRLDRARDTAVRCVNEAKMYDNNSFITLTYSDENLKSERLIYEHFQLFVKKLRRTFSQEMPILVTGEYGDQRKRPHWHSLIFNFSPKDLTYKYSNDRGDKVYSSGILDRIWGHGITEIGSVTFQSASYCARYAAKKLIHGNDQDHDYHPIHRRSSKYAIGKKFLEKYYLDIFAQGYVSVKNQDQIIKCPIPRYYEKWFKEKHPTLWETYVTKVKIPQMVKAQAKQEQFDKDQTLINHKRLDQGKRTLQITRNKVREEISKEKFKRLQQHLKGDI